MQGYGEDEEYVLMMQFGSICQNIFIKAFNANSNIEAATFICLKLAVFYSRSYQDFAASLHLEYA